MHSQTAVVQGIVFNEQHEPLAFAKLSYAKGSTTTNNHGFYRLEIPANQNITITLNYLGLKHMQLTVNLAKGEVREFNPVLKKEVQQISTVVITGNQYKKLSGITTLSPEVVRKIPGANAGVENILKTLPGVNSNNELSTQYAVRGGNYDENLVYVNGIQVYHPLLIRSGQQEGLSFINSDLVRSIDFSAGGFQAKYGDKLSSVLAVQYKRPVDFEGSLQLSFLGAQASVGGISKNKKFTGIVGIRYRNNSLLVKSKETETDFKPLFVDAQTFLTYQFSRKFEIDFLGNLSLNKYRYTPKVKKTTFGTINNPTTLYIFYNGQEKDQYQAYTAALKASYKASTHYTARFIASIYNTQEEEHYDILGQYSLGKPQTNIDKQGLGKVDFTRGVGAQLDHARNDLDGFFINLKHTGHFTYGKNKIDYGIKYTHQDTRDRIREYQMIDSVGYLIRPPTAHLPNNQPYQPFTGPLVAYTHARAENSTVINRLSGFAQWSYQTHLKKTKIWVNAGLRTQFWKVNGEGLSSSTHHIFSPRAQVALKPNWQADMVFRLAGGVYSQPPLYKALRDMQGKVHPDVKAQKSMQFIVGNDYSFQLNNRAFTLTSEAFYKHLTDVNPYTLENVRIRYLAKNNASAYAYGFDFRLNGELVKGTQSWLSIGYLNTQININHRGYISRPTDQRLKFALLFQDYVPEIPRLRLYINGVYNTGLPGGSPKYADPYEFQNRLPDYQRFDIGFSYVFVDAENPVSKNSWFYKFKELALGFEVFNMFDRQNSITNTFIRDVSSNRIYSVPNYLTTRVFNIKLEMKF